MSQNFYGIVRMMNLVIYKKLVILSIVPRHVSKIGTLMLVNPQSVMLRAVLVTFAYGLNSFVRRSVYRWNVVALVAISCATPCHHAGLNGSLAARVLP
jgi:hypothetical protein